MGSDLGFLAFERPVTPAELLAAARESWAPVGDLLLISGEADLVAPGGPRAWIVTFWSSADGDAGALPLDAVAAAFAARERVYVGFSADHHGRGGAQLHGPDGVRGLLALPGAPWHPALVPAVCIRWLASEVPRLEGDAALYFTERLVDGATAGRVGWRLARGRRWLAAPARMALRGDWWERWRCVWWVERWAEDMVRGG